MSSRHDRQWTATPPVELLPAQGTFTLGTLFRVVTAHCTAFGWVALVRFNRPDAVLAVLIAIVFVTAVIVGFRRHGSPPSRVLAAVWFVGLGLFISLYSALVSWVVRLPVDENSGRWAGLDQLVFGFALFAVLPAVIVALVFMVQAWTWSAYDGQLGQD